MGHATVREEAIWIWKAGASRYPPNEIRPQGERAGRYARCAGTLSVNPQGRDIRFAREDFSDVVVEGVGGVRFGSRARGDFSRRSDIDLAVYHDGMSSEEMNRLRIDLDDLPIIYRIDVVDLSRTSRPEFAASIARGGVIVYERPPRGMTGMTSDRREST